ncbi:POK9 protein, partial [Ramphastos sulfuratus]|nr:POK9 protein [Ramphastos sulfuratus]
TGSAGVDVSTAIEITSMDGNVHKIPLDAWGPLGGGLSALLVGCSSTTLQWLFVHVGVIDADFTGQILVMVSTPTPLVTVLKGSCIAQLVPLFSQAPAAQTTIREAHGFESTGSMQIFWAQSISTDRPNMTHTVSMENVNPSNIQISVMADTGADVTITS